MFSSLSLSHLSSPPFLAQEASNPVFYLESASDHLTVHLTSMLRPSPDDGLPISEDDECLDGSETCALTLACKILHAW